MLVKDLIAKLQEFDNELPVVVRGFDESGYDDLETVETVHLVRLSMEVRSPHDPHYDEVPEWREDSFTALLLNF